jgi:hypothetical protein
MGMIPWHMVPLDGDAPGEPLALDLITCVYNADLTQIDGGVSGGAACDYNNDGLEVWAQVPGSVNGFDFGTPYIAPGGAPAGNGNNLSLVTVIGMKFSNDGLKCLIVRGSEVSIYTFATAFLWSSATQTSTNVDTNGALGGTISWDGERIYTIMSGTGELIRWDLGAAWDVTTLTNAGVTATLPTAANGLAVSRDQSRWYVSAPNSPSVVQEFIASTPGEPNTIPVDGFGDAVPNYVLNVGAVMGVIADLNVSYDQTHLLISGATPPVLIATYTGDAIF